jgi:hypothetical protein
VVQRDQLNIEAGKGNGAIAIIRDNEEDREKPAFSEINGEDAALVGYIVGVSRDANFFSGMVVVSRIRSAGVRGWSGKVLTKCKRSRKATEEIQIAASSILLHMLIIEVPSRVTGCLRLE